MSRVETQPRRRGDRRRQDEREVTILSSDLSVSASRRLRYAPIVVRLQVRKTHMRHSVQRTVALVVCLVTFVTSRAAADVKLANLFSNGMVLQQGTAAPVWGTAEAGEAVTVSVAGQTAQATADASGKWVAKLPALTAGGPHEMVVKGKNEVKVADVLVGEVRVGSGQSNV